MLAGTAALPSELVAAHWMALSAVAVIGPSDRPLWMSQHGLLALAALSVVRTNIAHSLAHSCAMLAAALAVGHSQSTDPCWKPGQTRARATDLRLRRPAVLVAYCRMDTKRL